MKTEQTSGRRLRRFGLTVGGGLILLGALSWYRGHSYVPAALVPLGAALLLLGMVAPNSLRPVERFWLGLGTLLGWINTRIILSLLYYALFAPVGMIMRLFRDPLDRRLPDSRPSCWVRKDAIPLNPKAYENQF
jgi:saxitoxin biosynthesis operon SxtJ-like protein